MSKQSIKIVVILIIAISMFSIFKNLFSKSDPAVMENLIKNGAFLVDVRTPSEFASGHVAGSTNIPLDQVQNQLAKFKGKSAVIVFCRSGNRSSQAKSILENNGITNVTNGGTWEDVKEVIKNSK
uniref:rhodanese-like domain-containing protein n=2 Tax=Flavobacterium sp. TaxID=239 RepID=UPI004048F13D